MTATHTLADARPARRTARLATVLGVASLLAVTAGYLGGRAAWDRIPGDWHPLVILGGIVVAGAVVKRAVGGVAGALAAVLVVAISAWVFLLHPALTDLSDRAHHLIPTVPSIPSVHVPDVSAAAQDAKDAVGGAAAGASSAASRVSGAVDGARDAVSGATDQAKRLTGP